jgi:hypothetical protein
MLRRVRWSRSDGDLRRDQALLRASSRDGSSDHKLRLFVGLVGEVVCTCKRKKYNAVLRPTLGLYEDAQVAARMTMSRCPPRKAVKVMCNKQQAVHASRTVF